VGRTARSCVYSQQTMGRYLHSLVVLLCSNSFIAKLLECVRHIEVWFEITFWFSELKDRIIEESDVAYSWRKDASRKISGAVAKVGPLIHVILALLCWAMCHRACRTILSFLWLHWHFFEYLLLFPPLVLRSTRNCHRWVNGSNFYLHGSFQPRHLLWKTVNMVWLGNRRIVIFCWT